MMKCERSLGGAWRWFVLALAVLSSIGFASAQVLTNCTQAALQNALGQNGGLVLIQSCTISLTTPLVISVPEVTLRVTGTNVSINASNRARIFEVQSGSRLLVSDMTMSGGQAQIGGAVYVHDGAEAVFSNCTFTANSAIGFDGTNGVNGLDDWGTGGNGEPGQDGTNALGGAVFNKGNATFINCRFSSNKATGGNGGSGGDGGAGNFSGGNGGRGGNGAPARGGAIYNAGILVLSNSTVEINSVKAGDGALGGTGGTGPESGVAGSGGFGAAAAGAGVFNTGDAFIVNCTFYTNLVVGGNSGSDGTLNGGATGGDGYAGGGAYGGAICNQGNSYVTNCTFSFNRANGGAAANGGNGRFEAGDGGDGGDAYGGGVYSSGLQWLMNCTLSQNIVHGGTNGVAGTGGRAGSNGSLGKQIGAAVFGARDSKFYYKNTIFAYSLGSTNGAGPGLIAMGHNISDDTSITLGTGGIRTNPRLIELGNNGGPTRTMMLQPGSRAANNGDMEGAPSFDQRGFPRPGTGSDLPDIGALEVQGPAITNQPASVTVAPGGTAVFKVVATGDLPLTYIWKHDGSKITGATSATLTLTNVTEASAGQYSVIVSNAASFVESSPATLTIGTNSTNTNVVTAPVIVTQPATGAGASNIVMSFATVPGVTYVTEVSTNLAAANWIPLTTNFGNGTTVTNTDLKKNLPARFYRVRAH